MHTDTTHTYMHTGTIHTSMHACINAYTHTHRDQIPAADIEAALRLHLTPENMQEEADYCKWSVMCVCTHACMHVCMYACMHACMYACMHVCMYACMHVCVYACMHVSMYVHMLIEAALRLHLTSKNMQEEANYCKWSVMCVCTHACMYVCMSHAGRSGLL